MHFNSQKGAAHIFLVILLLIGLIAGVYLIKNPAVFNSKAYDSGEIKFVGYNKQAFKDNTTSNIFVYLQINTPLWQSKSPEEYDPSADPDKYEFPEVFRVSADETKLNKENECTITGDPLTNCVEVALENPFDTVYLSWVLPAKNGKNEIKSRFFSNKGNTKDLTNSINYSQGPEIGQGWEIAGIGIQAFFSSIFKWTQKVPGASVVNSLILFISKPDKEADEVITLSQAQQLGFTVDISISEEEEIEILYDPEQFKELGWGLEFHPEKDPITDELRILFLKNPTPSELEVALEASLETALGEAGGQALGGIIKHGVLRAAGSERIKTITSKIRLPKKSSNSLPKLPKNLITKPNDWNKFGIVYTRLAKMPLLKNEIDQRFFNTNGAPKKELTDIYRKVKESAEEILGEEDPQIYVVGGTVAKMDKTGYKSDLDIYIRTKKVPDDEIRQTVDSETNNLAYRIAQKANSIEVIPSNAKDPHYVDIMLSPFHPHEYSGLVLDLGDSEVFYDLAQQAWYSAATKGIPDIKYDISVALRSPEWKGRGNLPDSSFEGRRFGLRGGDIPVPSLAGGYFNKYVLPAIKAGKGFALSRSDVIEPAAQNVVKVLQDFEKRTGRKLPINFNLMDRFIKNGTAYVIDDRFMTLGAGYSMGDMIVIGFSRYDSARGIGTMHHEIFHLLGKHVKGFTYGGGSVKDRLFTAIYELMTDAWADLAMNQRIMSQGSHIATGGYAASNPQILRIMFNRLFAGNQSRMDDFLEFAITGDADKLTKGAVDDFIKFFRQNGFNLGAISLIALPSVADDGSDVLQDPVIELGPGFIEETTAF